MSIRALQALRETNTHVQKLQPLVWRSLSTTIVNRSAETTKPINTGVQSLELSQPNIGLGDDTALSDSKPKEATPSYKPTVPSNETISQLVNMIMRDGKKLRAQKLVSDTAKQLAKKIGEREDPYTVLANAIEAASPLVKIMNKKRHAKVIHVPKPLKDRQRRHQAIAWMLDAAKKRDETTFEQRFAAEVYEITTGTSSVLQKKQQVHKQALANRANAAVPYNTQQH